MTQSKPRQVGVRVNCPKCGGGLGIAMTYLGVPSPPPFKKRCRRCKEPHVLVLAESPPDGEVDVDHVAYLREQAVIRERAGKPASPREIFWRQAILRAKSVAPAVTHHEQHWLPRLLRVSAITLGDHVFWREELSQGILLHELTHVVQWRRMGKARFVAAYLRAYLKLLFSTRSHRKAYLGIPLEREARWVNRELDASHHPVEHSEPEINT